MSAHAEHIHFAIEQRGNERANATVSISGQYVHSLYSHALREHQRHTATHGFNKGAAPLTYFEHAFKNTIVEHLKSLFFTHCVINTLYKNLDEHSITIAGEPLIEDIELDPQHGAQYTFSLTQILPPLSPEWKKLPFKAPTRKNYKDLDRQVEHFLAEEQERATKDAREEITLGDWVYFGIILVDTNEKPLLSGHTDYAWIRISAEDVDRDSRELFLGKKSGDRFISTSDFFQEYISQDLDTRYIFAIEIITRVPHAFFSFDHFKRQFKLKTSRELHTKLIEVFSFRNDISQRREMATGACALLLKYYPFTAPSHLVSRQKESTIRSMHANPDYHVYKSQHDFKQKIEQLADKQVREMIMIDRLAHLEQLHASDDDVAAYLNLAKRPRTKEFIYFGMPSFKEKGHETPIPAELMRHCCLQEKALNHLINHLTRRT